MRLDVFAFGIFLSLGLEKCEPRQAYMKSSRFAAVELAEEGYDLVEKYNFQRNVFPRSDADF